jgi:hypothetical protein
MDFYKVIFHVVQEYNDNTKDSFYKKLESVLG